MVTMVPIVISCPTKPLTDTKPILFFVEGKKKCKCSITNIFP